MEDEIKRMRQDLEHLRDVLYGNGNHSVEARIAAIEKVAAVGWQAFIDLRGVMDIGFEGVNRRLDTTNGHIADLHSWRDRTIGALAVLSLIITTFGATALVLAAK